MNPTLYYRVIEEGVSPRIIIKYDKFNKFNKFWELYYSATDNVQRNQPKAENKRKASVLKINY